MREAVMEDLPQIVAMLADDALGSTREIAGKRIAGETVTSEAVTSEAATGETVTSEAVTSEAVTSEAVTSEAVTSEAATGETVTAAAVKDEAVTGRTGTEDSDAAVADCYVRAFRNISADPNSHLFVVCDGSNPTKVVGAFQITFTQYLSHQGSVRATIENVRVHRDVRNQGVGSRMIRFAIDYAKEQGASMVQLTTDKRRKDAHRFYERLGFVASHEGMKLKV